MDKAAPNHLVLCFRTLELIRTLIDCHSNNGSTSNILFPWKSEWVNESDRNSQKQYTPSFIGFMPRSNSGKPEGEREKGRKRENNVHLVFLLYVFFAFLRYTFTALLDVIQQRNLTGHLRTRIFFTENALFILFFERVKEYKRVKDMKNILICFGERICYCILKA